jgi:hypothetical protein
MALDDVWSVMKWVLLVLMAGFVGQFGKIFAQHILRKIRREKEVPADARQTPVANLPASPRDDISPPADHRAVAHADGQVIRETPVMADKKLLKTLAKQKKKEAKAEKKL